MRLIHGTSRNSTTDLQRFFWHEQKIFFGISIADVFLACPASLIAIVLVFVNPQWGYYLLAWVSFWFVWANIMTTATSLRFQKPSITLTWFMVFPFGADR